MKLFKSVDDKFKELGYELIEENKPYFVRYEKYISQFQYTHVIDLLHKASGKHLIQSYQKVTPTKSNFDIMVGLPIKEAKLCIKKMKKLGWI